MPALRKKTAAVPAQPTISAADEDSYVPLTALYAVIRYWWVLFLLILAGGLAGFLFHSLRPPVYEAVARFPASIDFVSAGPLTEREEDIALNAVGDLLYSKITLDKVAEKAAASGIQISALELKQSSVLERRINVWVLRVRGTDPQKAEQLARIWSEQGYADLQEGYKNALKAAQILRTMRSLESCLEQSVASESSGAQCSPARFAEIQADLRDAGEAYAKAKMASWSLSPTLVLGPLDPAVLSPRPVIFERNSLVLAGCMLGLLAGIWLAQSGLLERWLKRK